MNTQHLIVISGAAIIMAIFTRQLLSSSNGSNESYITPHIKDVPGFGGIVGKHTVHTVLPVSSESQSVAYQEGKPNTRSASTTDLVMEPGILHHKINVSNPNVGTDCSVFCDPDGTCHSPAFFECLHKDTSRYGGIGRERTAYDNAFRRVQYNQMTSLR